MRRRNDLSTDVLQPGDFFWRNIGWKEGVESAHLNVVIPPRETITAKYEIHWVQCSVNGGDTREDRLWNGDYDKPTVNGSWGIDHFHCWVHDGVLTTEDPKT